MQGEFLYTIYKIYTYYIQNYMQYIHCCPEDPEKLKIEII